MAAPAYADVGTETQATGTSAAANVPVSTANGDLLLMLVAYRDVSAISTPSGWTRIVNAAPWGSGNNWRVYVFWRTAASEPTSYTLTFPVSTNIQINMARVTGAHATAPIDQVASTNTPPTATTIDCPTVTTSGADRLICCATFQPHGENVTPPGGLTEQFDRAWSGAAMAEAFGTKAQATAGVTGTVTWTQPSESRNALGVTVAVAPPSTVVTPVADFIGTPLSGTYPLSVAFTDLSTNTPTSWAWTFGDGGTSTAQNPSHSYTASGTYTVTLDATNSAGSDNETKTGYVTVSALVFTKAGASLVGTVASGGKTLTSGVVRVKTGVAAVAGLTGRGAEAVVRPAATAVTAGHATVAAKAFGRAAGETPPAMPPALTHIFTLTPVGSDSFALTPIPEPVR